MKISPIRRALLGSMALGAAGIAYGADPYPTKPVLIIVPYPAGGSLDILVRTLAPRMSAELGQPVVVEARPGGNANIGADAVARAPRDGHTLLATTTFVVSNPIVDPATRWAPKDLTPVAGFAEIFSYLLVPATSPARSVRELMELARTSSAPLQFADGGPGTSFTMAFENLKKAAKVQLQGVPYKGTPPALLDLANGLLALAILPSSVSLPQIAAGKIRALATINAIRSPQLPDVPTLAEAGFPEATAATWFGLHAPAGTPADAVKRIDAAVRAATGSGEVRSRVTSMGGVVAYQGTAAFTAFLNTEVRRWNELAKSGKTP